MAYYPAGRASGSRSARGAQCRLTRLTAAVHAALALCAASAAMLPMSAAQAQGAAAAQAGMRGYSIPAGALADALPRFADSAGVTVLFDAALVGQRRTAGLQGAYSVHDGFSRLLAGSGLGVQERSAGVFVLQALPQGGVTQLAPVRIDGEAAAVTPAWDTSTDRRRMDDLQIRNWTDLGRRAEPGVNFNRTTNSINIRGLDQDRVLTRVDGIRLPWLDDGARGVKGGLEAVDFNSLSRLDIVRGADATGGGSGAISGIADLHTLNPADLLSDGKTFGALAKTDYDSADNSWGANAALAGQIHSNTFWLVQAGVRNGHELDNRGDAGGYGANRSKPSPEDYDQRSFLLKLQQRVDGAHLFGLTGEYFKRNADIDNMWEQGPGTSYLIGENSTRKETERERVSFDYTYTAPDSGSLIDTAHAVVYWQRVRLDNSLTGIRGVDSRARIIPGDPFRYGFPNGPYGRSNSIQQTLFGASTELTKRIAGASVSQLWSFGGEWYGNKTEQNSSGYDNCPVLRPGMPAPFGPRACDMLHTNQADVPQSKGDQWALWVQDEFSFADGRYTLAPALRYDHYEQRPQSTAGYESNPNAGVLPPSNSGSRFSPKLLGTWRAAEQLSLYAQYAYGFKAPSATQLYTNYGGPGTYLRVGNPYLKPETSKGWELGAKLGSDDLGGAVSFFDNRYQNFIDGDVPLNASSPQWQPGWTGQYPLGVTGNVNRAKVRIYGAEASAHWKFAPGWRTWGSLAWAVGKDEGTGQYLNSVAPLKAVLGVGYGRDVWGVDAMLTTAMQRNKVEYPEASADAPNPDFKAPGYGVVDLMGYWRPAAVKGLQVQAGVFNLFDKKYWEAINVPTAGATAIPRAVDWYTEPGRSVRVSLTYQY
ncbi:MAG: TonB-dependent hemoglobin/transferrin/lactoferrin family receptor [Achromobacter mucicolens]|uniref:TonB-dependent receptor n=1 Tax=Achromobacter mucicolens TaxID=1389922 RepID=UPI003D099EF7